MLINFISLLSENQQADAGEFLKKHLLEDQLEKDSVSFFSIFKSIADPSDGVDPMEVGS
jgi:hypothetical protein